MDRLRSTGLYSIHGRLLMIDLVMVWKSFYSDADLGLESLFQMARDVGTGGHRFKLAFPVCRSEVRKRYFLVEGFLCGAPCGLGLLKQTVLSALKGDSMSY